MFILNCKSFKVTFCFSTYLHPMINMQANLFTNYLVYLNLLRILFYLISNM